MTEPAKKYDQSVLVIKTEDYKANGEFQGFLSLVGREDIGNYLGTGKTGEPEKAFFLDRNIAEEDVTHKQLIPYCAIVCGTTILSYVRARGGNENRLHDKLSIGIGGHVDSTDDDVPFWAYLKGVIRELKEEIGLELDHNSSRGTIHGLVNDDTDMVGRVHLGVVHVINVNEQMAKTILENCEKNEIDNPRFIPITEFRDSVHLFGQLENWSQHVMGKLINDLAQPGPWEDKSVRERLNFIAVIASKVAAAAAGTLLQEDHRGFALSKGELENAVGELQCMLSGSVAEGDLNKDLIQDAGLEFRKALPLITKHQDFKAPDPKISEPE